jgi:site-specific DNA recombinase
MIDIYARVSRLRDKDQTTTASQVASCSAVLAERGLPVGEIHIDDGKSAWDPEVYRPGWNALMERIESGAADGVIVYDLERFARQLKDGERLVTAAERGLTVLDSEGEYDLRKPGDKKNFRNAIVSAEYYSDLLRVRTRRGKAAKANEGKVDRRRSFGFESDGITVREDEAQIIREHARRLLVGETQDSLIRELNTPATLRDHADRRARRR